jgi:hypothetical protein
VRRPARYDACGIAGPIALPKPAGGGQVDDPGAEAYSYQMDSAFISAFSALAGSIVGGLTSGLTTWMSLRSQTRANHRLHNVMQREELYRDFIVAASEIYGSAILNSEPQIQELVLLYGMISRMRVLSSTDVIACAETTLDSIVETYSAEKKTLREMGAMIKSGQAIDPLREFSRITREELKSL